MPNTIECRGTKVFKGVSMNSLVIYSDEGNDRHRYLLERIWNPDITLPVLMFIMAHPSTATLVENDHTLRICINRAINHHLSFNGQQFRGVCVTNLFTFVQRNTGRYERVNDQVGTENDRIIREYARRENTTTICAWGDGSKGKMDERYLPQGVAIKNMLLRQENVTLNHFYEIGGGLPKHPIGVDAGIDFREW